MSSEGLSDLDKRTHVLKSDESCQKYLNFAIREYFMALEKGAKHMYQAMPRLLTLWFEFTAIPVEKEEEKSTRSSRGAKAVAYGKRADNNKVGYKTDEDELLEAAQKQLKDVVQKKSKKLPGYVIYIALPQLIALSASHPNTETRKLIGDMLAMVTSEHPHQAMWSLAWLLQSNDEKRRDVAKAALKGATNKLKLNKKMPQEHVAKTVLVLKESERLFKHLKQLADLPVKEQKRHVTFKTWESRSGVKLTDFLPPIQAALSVNVARIMSAEERDRSTKGIAGDIFPLYVPRMQKFSSKVDVMPSKAKPKKLTVYMESADHSRQLGKMHFLIKREEKGDLRKDARVQDLNNVINRVLTGMVGGEKGSAPSSGNSGAGRRLQVRTFSVTCLSEDTGILEWVPNTVALRRIIQATNNPQCPESQKGKGFR